MTLEALRLVRNILLRANMSEYIAEFKQVFNSEPDVENLSELASLLSATRKQRRTRRHNA